LSARRVASAGALIAGFALAVAVVLGAGGDGGHSYRVLFETGGQLVPDNQVLVGGQAIGTIDEITLTDDAQAEVDITVDRPLHEGTTAVIRTTSLSGIANRYISLSPGPNSAPELEDGALLGTEDTTSPVDLDELFNTLDEPTRKALQDVIKGSAEVYTGNNEQARETYKYFAPALQSGERLLAELTRDERVFSEFLVSGSRILGTVADRRDDLSALTANANEALGAIAAENEALDRSLAALPPAMRQANTTFVNLRAALDDLDPLVETSKRATKDLPQFLRDLRPVVNRAVPVVNDLRTAVANPGADNDLTDVLRLAPRVREQADRASSAGIRAMNRTQDEIELFRAYTPELLALITRLGQASAYYDGNGHYVRVMPTATDAFAYNSGTSQLAPSLDTRADMFDFFTSTAGAFEPTGFLRCPGAGSQQAEDGSTPFLDGVGGDCDPADFVIPGAAP
jgi:phospholipid/cholesterol/gamma-HCH transport system substrate-binding protein